MGTPGKIVRQCTDTDSQRIHSAAQHYVEAARAFR
jgi:carbonic anhydrase/acetyltransferase-like protein (isoleucine patch superfamily)